MRILDSEDIDREYHSGEKMLEKLAKDNAVKYIREHMIAIDILSSMINNPHRYMEIAERYEKIIPVTKKYFVEKDVFFSYYNFLSDSGQRWNAKKFIEELVAFYKANSEHFTPKEFAQVYVLYGDVYAKMNIYSDAGRAYRKALKQLKKEPEENAYKMVLTEKLTQSVLEVGKRYRSHYVYEYGNISYRLSAVNLLFRCIQKNIFVVWMRQALFCWRKMFRMLTDYLGPGFIMITLVIMRNTIINAVLLIIRKHLR